MSHLTRPQFVHVLGRRGPDALYDTRVQLLWAAQLLEAVAAAADESADEPTLQWSEPLFAMLSPEVGAGVRVGLQLREPALILADADAQVVDHLALDQRSLEQARDWLVARLTMAADRAVTLPPCAHLATMPEHAVAHGAPFDFPDRDEVEELGFWFANAARLLEDIRGRVASCSSPRIWPRPLGIACVEPLLDGQGGGAGAMAIGLSAGDGAIDEPYWYVAPTPAPRSDVLPDLERGGWHRDGWLGAVLRASTLMEQETAGAQADLVAEFIAQARAACRQLLAA